MHLREFVLRALLLPWVLLQPGCSSWLERYQNLKEPQVSLVNLALKDPNLLAPVFLVRLLIENPNDVSVNLDGADASLSLDGSPVASGVSRSPLILDSKGASEVELDIHADTLSAIQQLGSLLSKDSIQYRVAGHLNVVNWLGPLGSFPFSFQGSVERDVLLRGL